MAYEITNKAYLCRTIRSTKLYARPNDIKPTNIIIPSEITLTTSEFCNNGIVQFLKISDIISDNKNEEWIGKWISSAEVEKTEILREADDKSNETQFDDSVAVNEELIIKASEIVLYENGDSGTGFSMEFPIGSLIKADKKININFNGTPQTRYRIKNVYSPDGFDLIIGEGSWVRLSPEVSLKSDIDNTIVVPNYPMLRSSAKDRENAKNKRNGTTSTKKDKKPKNDKERAKYEREQREKNLRKTTSQINREDAMNTKGLPGTPSQINRQDNQTIKNKGQTGGSSGNSIITRSNSGNQYVNQTYDVETFNNAVEGYRQGYQSTGKSIMGTPIGRMLFVHGMPFQFTHYTDRRPGSEKQYGNSSEYYDLTRVGRSTSSATADFYGRIFEKEIASNIPIMSVVPGEPQFLTMNTGRFVLPSVTGASNKLKNEFSKLFSADDFEVGSIVDSSNALARGSNVYQYYSMTINTKEYFKYVNTLCKMSAVLMGLKDFTYNGKSCTDIDWGDQNSTASNGGSDFNLFEEVIGVDGGVSFAYDPGSSVTDSLGNSLGESQFASLLKTLSGKAKEFSFIAGSMGYDRDWTSAVDNTDYDKAMSTIGGSNLFGPNSLVGRLATFISNAGRGMNVRFPQIWQDSTYSKSYSVDMKFVTPYATNFCKWRYVLVPFFHCFAFAAPRMINSLTNYSRPFLIRAYSKGYFNVEMGMIESLQWRRFGDGDMISDDGIPTEIDVTIDFVDMYQALGMSKIDGGIFGVFNSSLSAQVGLFFNNSGLMDLLGTLSGVNMNRMNMKERFALYWNAYYTGITNMPGNFKRAIQDRLRNTYEKWFARGL